MKYVYSNGDELLYPYALDTLRRANPNTSFPRNPDARQLAPLGIFPVVEVAPPVAGPLKTVVEDAPVQISTGAWYQSWRVVDLPDEEKGAATDEEWQRLRTQRDALLQACDWTQLKDVPDEVSVPWADYRARLRGLTSAADPFSVRWPQPPELQVKPAEVEVELPIREVSE